MLLKKKKKRKKRGMFVKLARIIIMGEQLLFSSSLCWQKALIDNVANYEAQITFSVHLCLVLTLC